MKKVDQATGRLRFAVPPGTSVGRKRLQQEWEVTSYNSGYPPHSYPEWRDVPTEVEDDD